MASEPFRWAGSGEGSGDVIEADPAWTEDALHRRAEAADRAERDRRGLAPPRAGLLLAGIADTGGLMLLHLGDTRAYLARPAPMARDLPVPLAPHFSPEVALAGGGGMVCLTWDHSSACELVEMGLVGRDDGRRRACRRVLTRGLGDQPESSPDELRVATAPGDRLLLCNADLWLAVDDVRIAEILVGDRGADPAALAARLVDEAVRAGELIPGRRVRPQAAVIEWLAQPAARAVRSPAGAMIGGTDSGGRARRGVLERVGRDLTALAVAQAGPPPAGRGRELRAMIRGLLRMQKPNLLLVGEPGVGKTWLVEALACTLASPGCPPALAGARIVEISMGALLAGARFRGDFEERLEEVIAAAAAEPGLILFLDELHVAMGAGAGAEGAPDAANLLKPALSSGRLRLIGATTPREMERHIARDEAFLRRFEVIRIEEPARAEAIEIAAAVAGELAAHHGVEVAPAAIEAAVDLSVRYLPDRRLPDKAIDLLDQACVRAVSRWLSLSFSAGATAAGGQRVDRADVAAVVAERCRIPVELVELDHQARLAELPRLLGERVFGQDAAVDAVARALGRAYRGLRDPRRPVASFLFAGPTGVGKTALARAIAELLFDSPAALLRLDMAEYMEKHAVARLLGAPPGYVGHEEEGLLVSALRRRPASVVLFDEIEKAHPDVLDLLLQILDDGTVRGSRGGEASFREAVVVATSNLLADQPRGRAVGFGAAPVAGPDEADLRAALEQRLRPELIGRLGHVIRFAPLTDEAARRIAARQLQVMVQRLLAQQSIDAPPPAALRERILGQAIAGRYGGRDLERMVDDELDRWLAGERTAGPPPAAGAIVVDALRGRPRWTGALLLVRGVGADDVPGLLRAVQACPEAADLVLLRHAGDGALALFGGAAAALACARAIPAPRRVLHWGTVTREAGAPPSGPDLDHLLALGRSRDPVHAGAEVHITPAAAEHLV